MTTIASPARPLSKPFEIRFDSLFSEGRALAFPCDEAGHVDLDALPSRARENYLFARTLIGRDFAPPVVCARAHG